MIDLSYEMTRKTMFSSSREEKAGPQALKPKTNLSAGIHPQPPCPSAPINAPNKQYSVAKSMSSTSNRRQASQIPLDLTYLSYPYLRPVLAPLRHRGHHSSQRMFSSRNLSSQTLAPDSIVSAEARCTYCRKCASRMNPSARLARSKYLSAR